MVMWCHSCISVAIMATRFSRSCINAVGFVIIRMTTIIIQNNCNASTTDNVQHGIVLIMASFKNSRMCCYKQWVQWYLQPEHLQTAHDVLVNKIIVLNQSWCSILSKPFDERCTMWTLIKLSLRRSKIGLYLYLYLLLLCAGAACTLCESCVLGDAAAAESFPSRTFVLALCLAHVNN